MYTLQKKIKKTTKKTTTKNIRKIKQKKSEKKRKKYLYVFLNILKTYIFYKKKVYKNIRLKGQKRSCQEYISTKAHKGHGKTKNSTAKQNISRQLNNKYHGKIKFFTAKQRISRQNIIIHGKTRIPQENKISPPRKEK